MPTREDYAWAAGFIDGEGSFNWNRTRPGYGVPRFSVAQVDTQPIERLMDLFPFLSLEYRQPRLQSPQAQWVLWANGYEKVQAVMAALWPWLSQFKRNDARTVLSLFRQQTDARKVA